MATEIAKAYVQIIPSASGISGKLSGMFGGEAESAGKSAGSTLGNSLVSTLKSVIAAAGVGKILKDTLSAGGDLQQSFGGLETIYGDAAAAAKEYSKEAQAAGISMNDYAEQAVSFGASLKQAYGGDTAKAVEAANTAILDMADNAAKMGTPLESIQNAYQGFAKQNYTMLDNLKLGYGGTKQEMERLLADAQKLSGVEYNIDNLGDVYDAIHVIQEDLGLTGVAADEAKNTFTGSFGAMKAAAKNLMASLSTGMDISPALSDIVSSAQTFLVGNLLPMLRNILTGIPTIFQEIFGGIDWNTMLTNAMTALQTALPNAMAMITGFTDAGLQFMAQLGEGLRTGIPEFLANILPMIEQFTANIRENAGKLVDGGIALIKNIVQGLISAIPDLLANVPQIIINIMGVINDNLPKLLKAGVDIVLMLIKGIIQNIPNIIANAGKIVEAIWSTITAFNWLDLGSKIIRLFGNGIKALIKFPLDFIKSMVKSFIETIKSGGGIMSWSNVGKSIIDGIVNGLRAVGSQIKDVLMGFAKEAFEAVKSFFGIKSPSKLMRDEVGKQLIAGMAIGVEKNQGLLDSALNDAVSGAEANLNVSGTTVGYTPSGSGGSVVINVYATENQDVNSLANIIMQKLTRRMQAEGMAFA